MKKVVKALEIILYIIVGIVLISLFIKRPLIPRNFGYAFIGLLFLGFGIIGILKKQILIAQYFPFYYKKGSLWIIMNIVYCIIGFWLLILNYLVFK